MTKRCEAIIEGRRPEGPGLPPGHVTCPTWPTEWLRASAVMPVERAVTVTKLRKRLNLVRVVDGMPPDEATFESDAALGERFLRALSKRAPATGTPEVPEG